MSFNQSFFGFLSLLSASLCAVPALAKCSQADPLAKLNDFGIAALPANPAINKKSNLPEDFSGLVIAAVDPQSDAGKKGLARGDGILTINYTPVSDMMRSKSRRCIFEESQAAILLQIKRGILGPSYVPVRKLANNNDTSWLTGGESVAAVPHQSATAPIEEESDASRAVAIASAKRKCSELGLTPGTEKFGQCVLKVSE